jgi:phage-related holin
MNDVVALGIAVTKAVLVLLFGGFLWLAILIGITLTDYMSRGATMPVPGK